MILPVQGHMARRETSHTTCFVLKRTLDQTKKSHEAETEVTVQRKKAASASHPGGASRRHVRALSPVDAAVIWLIMSLQEAGKPI